jgi:chemotaxis protein MotB
VGLSRAIAIVTSGAALGAVGFGWYSTNEAKKQVATQQAVATECQKSLTACGGERDTKDKAAGEAAANLTASRAELEELRAEHAEAEKRLASFKALTEKFQKMIDSGKLSVVIRNGRMVVKLPAAVLFASGSAELSKEGKDALRDVAAILRTVHDRRFMVAGHTDNVPIDSKAVPPSPFKNNLELSTGRALVVSQALIAAGMNPARLVAAGYAEHEPVKDNNHEAGRQENRRIEIVLMPNLTEIPAIDAGAPTSARPSASASAQPVDAGKPADAGHP